MGAALLLAAMAAGCTTDRFVPLAAEFGTLTREAAEQQSERLAIVTAEERERLRAGLAERGADLRVEDCARAIAGARVASTGVLPDPPARCRVIERQATGTFAELPGNLQLPAIAALNGALQSYAEGLIVLAADTTEQQAAFGEAAAQLASAIGELDGAVRAATGAESGADPARVDAAGTLLGRIGNAYLSARRQAVLRRLIVEADPLVAQATGLLGGADGALDLYDSVALYAAIERAAEAAAAARAAGDAAALAEQQAALFDAVDAYNAFPAEQARYAAIGAAHARLAAAAEAGASPAELASAATAVIGLAEVIGATRDAFAEGDR